MRCGQYRTVADQLIEAVEFGSERFLLTVIYEGIAPVKKCTPMGKNVEDSVRCKFQIEKLKRG